MVEEARAIAQVKALEMEPRWRNPYITEAVAGSMINEAQSASHGQLRTSPFVFGD